MPRVVPRYYSAGPPDTSTQSSLISYNAQLFSHLSHKQLEKAEKLIEEMQQKGVEPDIVSWKTLLLMYRKCEMKEEAERVEEVLKAKGMDNVMLWRLAEYLHELQDQRHAQLLLSQPHHEDDGETEEKQEAYLQEHAEESQQDEQNPTPDLLTLNTLIGLYGEMDNVPAVESALASLHQHSYVPNLDTYHSLILMYCRLNNVKRVKELKEEMKAKDIHPNAKMLDAMLVMYSKMGMDPQMQEIIEEYLALRRKTVKKAAIDLIGGKAPVVSEKKKKDAQEVAAYATIVELYVKLGKAKEADDVIRGLADNGILDSLHLASYNSLLSLYSRLGHKDKANQLLHHMNQNSITPNLVTKILHLNFGKLQEMKTESTPLEREGCYNLLATTYAQLGQLEKVLEVVKEMSKYEVFVTESTSEIIKTMVKDRGNTEKLEETTEEGKQEENGRESE